MLITSYMVQTSIQKCFPCPEDTDGKCIKYYKALTPRLLLETLHKHLLMNNTCLKCINLNIYETCLLLAIANVEWHMDIFLHWS